MKTGYFDSFDNQSHLQFTNPQLIEKDLQILSGIISGIKCDDIINDKEYNELLSWINSRKEYEFRKPYSEVVDLLRQAIEDRVLTSEESESIVWFCDQYINKSGYYNALTGGIQKLVGIVKGIVADNEINLAELEYLDNWLEENEFLKNTWPYDELYNITTSIFQDKHISKEEHETLLNFCKALVGDTVSENSSNTELVSAIKTGFYQIDPTIEIQEKTFCITGLSKKYKRKEIAEKIELYGGFVTDSISGKLNYLVVCDEKNSCWAFTCYGRKIEQAINHRRKGANLVIVHEYDLYDTLENL